MTQRQTHKHRGNGQNTNSLESDSATCRAMEYQNLLKSGCGGSELSRAAEAALDGMCDRIEKIAYIVAKQRWGTPGLYDHLGDVCNEAYALALDAVATFDPGRGISLGLWVDTSLNRSLPRSITVANRHGSVPASWERLNRIAPVAAQALTQELRRVPTRSELRVDLERWCWGWARDRGEAGADRLKRSGMTSALANLDRVLAADQAPKSFDAPMGENGDESLYDTVGEDELTEELALADLGVGSELIPMALGGMDQESRRGVVAFLEGTEPATRESKRCLREMGARLAAPQCQYAYLSGVIAAAFLPDDIMSPPKRGRSGRERLAAAGRH